MNAMTWVQILDKAVCISHNTNWERYESDYFISGQSGHFKFCMATHLEERKLWIHTFRLDLKIDLACEEGWVNT